MLRFSKAKTIGVVLLTLAAFLYAMPSLLTQQQRDALKASIPSFIPAFIVPHQAIVLGLDLQGGSHVLLEVADRIVGLDNQWKRIAGHVLDVHAERQRTGGTHCGQRADRKVVLGHAS